jgi:hypothetical protein
MNYSYPSLSTTRNIKYIYVDVYFISIKQFN